MVANIPMENPDPFSSTLVALGSSRMALHCAFAAAAACAASEWDATRFRTASQLRWGLGAEVSISSLFCIIYIYIYSVYILYIVCIYILCIYIYTCMSDTSKIAEEPGAKLVSRCLYTHVYIKKTCEEHECHGFTRPRWRWEPNKGTFITELQVWKHRETHHKVSTRCLTPSGSSSRAASPFHGDIYPLVICYIAMEALAEIDGLPNLIAWWICPWLCKMLVITRG